MSGLPDGRYYLQVTDPSGSTLNGSFIVWRETAKKRMVAKLHAIKAELIRLKHEPTAKVGEWLKRVLLGYYQYHAIPGNKRRLCLFRHRVGRLWRNVLQRRSQKAELTWQQLTLLFNRWLPFPSILRPYPQVRFAARHPR